MPRSKRPCQNCGQPLKRVRIVYGYPTDEAFERADAGELVIGGCQPGGPKYACSNCHVPLSALTGDTPDFRLVE